MRFSAALAADQLLPRRVSRSVRPLAMRLDGLLTGTGEGAVAGRLSVTAFSIRILSAAIALLSQVLLARWMGSFEYGIFVLVWLTAVVVGNISCFGFQTAIIRYAPEYLAKGRLEALRGILATSRIFALVASSIVALLAAAGLYIAGASVESYYVAPFYLGFLILPMIALGDTLDGTARSQSWVVAALSPTYIVRPLLILGFMGAFMGFGLAPTARTALVASIAATYATTLMQFALVTLRLDRAIPAGSREILFGEWFRVALPIFLVEGFFFLMTNADVLMVGRYMDPTHVAVYYATVKTLALVHFVYFAVKAGVAPRYSQLMHSGDRARLEAFVHESSRWTFWPSLVMAVAVLAIGWPMLMLFGKGFTEGYPLLFVLVLGVVARASVGPAESLLNMSDNERICAAVYGITLALNLAMNAILIPAFGLPGAAAATSGAMIFEAAALSLTVRRRLGITMFAFAPTRSHASSHRPSEGTR